MKRRGHRGADATGRSKREGKHVRHYEYMLASAAYRSLSLVARCLLLELHRLYNGENNGNLFLSVREAANRIGGVGKSTTGRAFEELHDKGFIRPHQRGSFSLKIRHATTWILTEFGHAGQLATKEFMTWAPSKKQNTVPVVGPYGTCGRTVPPKTAPKTAPKTPSTVPVVGPSSPILASDGTCGGTQIVYHEGSVVLGEQSANTIAKQPWRAPSYEVIERAHAIAKLKLPANIGGASAGAPWSHHRRHAQP